VLERWQDPADAPPLHVNDSAAERHSHRIVSGSQVAKEMETLLFGSFADGTPAPAPGGPLPGQGPGPAKAGAEAPVPVPASAPPATAAPAAAPAAAPGGKRSFMDVSDGGNVAFGLLQTLCFVIPIVCNHN
jgi:hypothetical protein